MLGPALYWSRNFRKAWLSGVTFALRGVNWILQIPYTHQKWPYPTLNLPDFSIAYINFHTDEIAWSPAMVLKAAE